MIDGLGLLGLVLIVLGVGAALVYRPTSRRLNVGQKLDGGAVFPSPSRHAPCAPGVDVDEVLHRLGRTHSCSTCRGRRPA